MLTTTQSLTLKKSVKNTRWRCCKKQEFTPVTEVSKAERCGKTEIKEAHENHTKKINKQGWSAFSATHSGRKLQVVLGFRAARIWKQAHNVWRQDWLLPSWLHDNQAWVTLGGSGIKKKVHYPLVTPHTIFYCWMYSHFPLVKNRLITHNFGLDQQKVLTQRMI